ncbi:hypothetical protein JW988_00490 [Candidatus Bathyarchaeota archaeon]|nr:hypothetical protein [Candidatus Bathyarchaeota archaeon]
MSHWQIHDDGPNGRPKVPQSLLLMMAGLPTTANTITKPSTLKPEIINFVAKMKADNYSEDTIESYGRALVTLTKRGADLYSVQSMKDVIANQKTSNGTKQNMRNATMLFLKYQGIQANPPKYRRIRKWLLSHWRTS